MIVCQVNRLCLALSCDLQERRHVTVIQLA